MRHRCHQGREFVHTSRSTEVTCRNKLRQSFDINKSSAVCVLKGVPIITTGSLKSRKNGNPGMPIFTGCVYFHDTGKSLKRGYRLLTFFLSLSVSQASTAENANVTWVWMRQSNSGLPFQTFMSNKFWVQ